MTKKSLQKLKYLENEKSFYDEIKAIFIIFKGLKKANNTIFLKRESQTLR